MPGRTPHEWVRRVARILPYRRPRCGKGRLLRSSVLRRAPRSAFCLDPVVENHIPVAVFYPFVIVAIAWGASPPASSTSTTSRPT
jgi:hypothetical protein